MTHDKSTQQKPDRFYYYVLSSSTVFTQTFAQAIKNPPENNLPRGIVAHTASVCVYVCVCVMNFIKRTKIHGLGVSGKKETEILPNDDPKNIFDISSSVLVEVTKKGKLSPGTCASHQTGMRENSFDVDVQRADKVCFVNFPSRRDLRFSFSSL